MAGCRDSTASSTSCIEYADARGGRSRAMRNANSASATFIRLLTIGTLAPVWNVRLSRRGPAIGGEAIDTIIGLPCAPDDSGGLFGGPVVHAFFPSRMKPVTRRSSAAGRLFYDVDQRFAAGQPIQISRNHPTASWPQS